MVILKTSMLSGQCAVQGYTLFSRKQKLKSEYIGRSNEEIRDLRLSGQVQSHHSCVQYDTFSCHTLWQHCWNLEEKYRHDLIMPHPAQTSCRPSEPNVGLAWPTKAWQQSALHVAKQALRHMMCCCFDGDLLHE